MSAKAAKGVSKGFYNTKIALKKAFYEVINDQNQIKEKSIQNGRLEAFLKNETKKKEDVSITLF
jgi:hypothetical protein